MSNLSQKDAVYQAIVNTIGEVEAGTKVNLSKEERDIVHSILVEGFTNDTIKYDGPIPTGSELKNYVTGLVSNWLRKDSRLNGGVKYQPKNPGSRAGIQDPQVKAMRALLATKSDPSERAEIQAFIDRRVAEIKPTKTVTVNFADLPPELQAKYSSNS